MQEPELPPCPQACALGNWDPHVFSEIALTGRPEQWLLCNPEKLRNSVCASAQTPSLNFRLALVGFQEWGEVPERGLLKEPCSAHSDDRVRAFVTSFHKSRGPHAQTISFCCLILGLQAEVK